MAAFATTAGSAFDAFQAMRGCLQVSWLVYCSWGLAPNWSMLVCRYPACNLIIRRMERICSCGRNSRRQLPYVVYTGHWVANVHVSCIYTFLMQSVAGLEGTKPRQQACKEPCETPESHDMRVIELQLIRPSCSSYRPCLAYKA